MWVLKYVDNVNSEIDDFVLEFGYGFIVVFIDNDVYKNILSIDENSLSGVSIVFEVDKIVVYGID